GLVRLNVVQQNKFGPGVVRVHQTQNTRVDASGGERELILSISHLLTVRHDVAVGTSSRLTEIRVVLDQQLTSVHELTETGKVAVSLCSRVGEGCCELDVPMSPRPQDENLESPRTVVGWGESIPAQVKVTRRIDLNTLHLSGLKFLDIHHGLRGRPRPLIVGNLDLFVPGKMERVEVEGAPNTVPVLLTSPVQE